MEEEEEGEERKAGRKEMLKVLLARHIISQEGSDLG